MNAEVEQSRVQLAGQQVFEQLLAARGTHGHWEGQLSTSALSTATAVMALEQVRRQLSKGNSAHEFAHQNLIDGGLTWLADHQNEDGGWGDTTRSISNISTTMLAHAVFHATGTVQRYADRVEAAANFIEQSGGVPAMIARYGCDKTFSVPILTHCALAGLVDWKQVPALPFELACVPARFYAAIRLPVVSYALPALIAIGQVRHHFNPPWNPLIKGIRNASINRSLKILSRIQPPHGGFLEATPLTSFVTMSLAAKGLVDHPVVKRGIEFICSSVREDGSWPIDTNLATWVTTLSVNALEDHLPVSDHSAIEEWLIGQQYTERHPYTNAQPGGWAWTDLPGGVPDGDDTPGAILALLNLQSGTLSESAEVSIRSGMRWLLQIQNRDGGWPTFCRGWGTLPFDRSSCDITAHCLRALFRGKQAIPSFSEVSPSIKRGFDFLEREQRDDGSWLPLWFGNQYAADDINPVYGTTRVLAAYRDLDRISHPAAQRGLGWLRSAQNDDGGWGGVPGVPSSVEETALVVELLTSDPKAENSLTRGFNWLTEAIESGRVAEASPIGFYFARLWYFENLYPLIFTASAMRRVLKLQESTSRKNS